MTPGSGMGKKVVSGSGLNNSIIIPRAYKPFFLVKILKFFDADPGWKKFDTWDKHPGSATLIIRLYGTSVGSVNPEPESGFRKANNGHTNKEKICKFSL